MSEPYYTDDAVTLYHGDALDVLRSLPDASVDAVVTDPPYNLGFMGQAWDRPASAARGYKTDEHLAANPYGCARAEYGGTAYGQNGVEAAHGFEAWCADWSRECLRVLKPGGHLLAFGGTRTWHRLACAVEDAGFEVRDSIAWLYGSGFPKSLDVSKAIDKAAGAEREAKGWLTRERVGVFAGDEPQTTSTSGNLQCPHCLKWKFAPDHCTCPRDNGPQTDAARTWQGWGTALKPAHEPIVVARKPPQGTVAANVLAHGTGALNVDGCRVGMSDVDREAARVPSRDKHGYGNLHDGVGRNGERFEPAPAGRWPANVVLDESQAAALDEQNGESLSRIGKPHGADHGEGWGMTATGAEYDDIGGASRFFYVAKAGSNERVRVSGTAHPTVKPLALMRWLVRLVTPPGGTVLEPFAGSGTTVEACLLEGFQCVAIERETDYLPLIIQRINRRRDPVAAVRATGDDGGLFDLIEEGA